jgi:pyridinium-3,5-bisthiocarboxylic acid mononucleotide nickel chelatase
MDRQDSEGHDPSLPASPVNRPGRAARRPSGGAAPAGSTTVWFHCFAGIAGDMALGALLDAGADLADVRALIGRVPIEGWSLDAEPTMRNGIAATHASVRTADTAIVRTYAHIRGLLEEARLPERVLARALGAFGALATVEGRLHRRPPSQVHFHEVGAIDAIVDIVGTCAALEVLDVDIVTASPVATGMGMVRTAHGMLPNPAPAVVELLRGAPTYGLDIPVEMTTPTGAALLAALVTEFGPQPAMSVSATGFGAGTRELETLPNLTQAIVGTSATPRPSGQTLQLLETNVDDVTGETLAHTVAALLDAGALDAWVAPIVGKKGRPAHLVSALCDPVLTGEVAAVLAAETGTLGIRGHDLERWSVPRTFDSVDVDGAKVRIKISPGRIKAEHEDAVRVARRTGLPLREVVRRAEAAWRDRPLIGEAGLGSDDGMNDDPA